jgi:hypothetical protein
MNLASDAREETATRSRRCDDEQTEEDQQDGSGLNVALR